MEIFIFLSWILISLIIPLALLVVGFGSYLKGQNLSKIIPRLFLAFVGYIFVAIVTSLFVGGMMNASIHKKPDHKVLDLAGQIVFTALILTYAASGWLLCSFVRGKFIKPLQILGIDKEKPQSVFDSK
ncbi:MAG: hypothetical protein JWN60_3295 [Acidobacteria bacterium]|nr:hypothetical protein [Acidobacteriota bacterium]